MIEESQPPAELTKKPSVWAIVILAILRGGFGLLQGTQNIGFYNANQDLLPGWIGIVYYAIVAMALVMFGAAFFIWQRKRLGLQLGVLGFGVDLVLGILVIVLSVGEGYDISTMIGSSILPFVIDGLVLYYLYKYLNQMPERTFFT